MSNEAKVIHISKAKKEKDSLTVESNTLEYIYEEFIEIIEKIQTCEQLDQFSGSNKSASINVPKK